MLSGPGAHGRDSDPSEPSFDPTTEDDDGEGDESEDSDSDHSAPHSAATTRSRSRPRRSPDGKSSDHSYQGGLSKSGHVANNRALLCPCQECIQRRTFWGRDFSPVFSVSGFDWTLPSTTLSVSQGPVDLAFQAAVHFKLLSEPACETVGKDRRLQRDTTPTSPRRRPSNHHRSLENG